MSEREQLPKSDEAPSPEDAATPHTDQHATGRLDRVQVAGTGFAVWFCIVGISLWGRSFDYDFMGAAIRVDAGA